MDFKFYVHDLISKMQLIRVVNKFKNILSKHQKLRIFELSVLMVIGGFLEMLSVSLVLPFMDAVMNPDETMDKWYVRAVCELLNIHSATSFLAFLAFILGIVYILKNLFLLFEYNIQYHFVYGNMFSMQRQLLWTFLHRPYEYYLRVNSGEVIRIVENDTLETFQLLSVLIGLLTELIVSATLIGTVFFVAPVVTTCMGGVLAVLVWSINCFIKPVLRKAGIENQRAAVGMNKWLLQSIQGIKELIVMQREEYFQEQFDRHGAIRVDSIRKNNLLNVIPKFLIEAVSMSAMFFVVGIFIFNGNSLEAMIPILATVAVAALRLLPSVNRISAALTHVSYAEVVLDQLIDSLKVIEGGDDVSLAWRTASKTGDNHERLIFELKNKISLENVTYRYPGDDGFILENSYMEIQKGTSVGIVGASGAGKTTSVDIVLGLLKPQSGNVMVDGIDIREDPAGWLSQVGYIPQTIFMMDDTIRANVAFGQCPGSVDDEDIWKALDEASLGGYVRTLPDRLDTQIGERGVRLSGGQRQRIGIARALYINPSILIFDEATSSLDNETEKDIMESIENLHGTKTMLIIAHRLSTIDSCDHVYRVSDSKIELER